jgi:hypothetical protein
VTNALYKKGAHRVGTAAMNLDTASFRVAIVASTYVPNLATHEFLTDIASHRLGTDQVLDATFVDGVFDAPDVSFPPIAPGSTAYAVVIYQDTGVAGTSPLLYFTDELTGFPFITSGAGANVLWNSGPYKIFAFA